MLILPNETCRRFWNYWVRILSVYGPNDNAGSMVMSTVRKLKNGETPQFTKGEQKWDYLYSGDAARAFRLLAEKGQSGKVYVLGSGNVKPLSEYIYNARRRESGRRDRIGRYSLFRKTGNVSLRRYHGIKKGYRLVSRNRF